MAEYEVLHQEPRHRVDEFVDEMLGRARLTVAAMGPAFERLLREMVAQFQAFQARHYLLTLERVRFEWMRWTRDGHLVIEFTPDGLAAPPADPPLRHQVVDAFVDDVVGRAVPDALRGEFSQFVRGMVQQFALLKKHALALDLGAVEFDRLEWLTDRQLAIRMTHHGQPLVPRDVGW